MDVLYQCEIFFIFVCFTLARVVFCKLGVTCAVQRGNSVSVAVTCHLISCILHNTQLTGLILRRKPSECVGHVAWKDAGLPVPPIDVVAEGWKTTLSFIRVRHVPAFCYSLLRSRVPPLLAAKADCGFPHRHCRCVSTCSAPTCALYSLLHPLLSCLSAAACLLMFGSGMRC